MIQRIFQQTCVLFCCFWIGGCGGGSQGTGGVTIEGRVLELAGQPIGGITVTVAETGESTQSDAVGAFVLEAPKIPQIGLIFEQGALSVQATLADVPAGTTVVRANFEIDRVNRSVKQQDVSFRDDDESSSVDERDDSHERPASDDNGDDSLEGDDDELSGRDDREEDRSEDGDSQHGNGRDDGDEEEANPGEENNGGGSSGGGSGSGSGENENRDARGQITALSASSVVVDGITFVPNGETEYRNRGGDRGSLADFSVGDRVRARGELRNSVVVLERLEFEDD